MEPIVAVLPNLSYTCSRCGVTVSHPDDVHLVKEIAVQHNTIKHRRRQVGDVEVRWRGVLGVPQCDLLRDALCEALEGDVDVWVDEFGAQYAGWRGDEDKTLQEVLAVVSRYAGTELEVVNLR